MPGKIKVKILAGRNLPVMDRSGDTTDGYVEIKFGCVTYKTDVCRKTLNPQWNSEWYRFEVDDAELQDEPLQIRLMDHDTYSANDSIGKVYINLNPLLLPGLPLTVKNIWTLEATINSSTGSQSGSVMAGWIPVYDTMHGIRGEVNIIVKVELFSDFNKFKQSSCGVQFFYSPNIPHGYHAQVIHGFVEELIVSDDPEYKWIDKIRTPRASNEARQTLFLKLSGEVQRKIGLKALDLGGNAVIGYIQTFDLEGESGIVARGIGTAATLVKLQDPYGLPYESMNAEDHAWFSLQSKNLFECSESDDGLPLLSQSPSHSPISSRSPIKIYKTRVGNKFPVYEKFSKDSRPPTRITEIKACTMKSHLSLQDGPMRNIRKSGAPTGGSTLSLSDDLISESSLRLMLALEDMRGERTSAFSRGLKNLRHLPKRVIQIKSKFSDSCDDESDQDSNYSSTWSIMGGSDPNRSSISDLKQTIRRKKFTHKKNSIDSIGSIAASLIRSVHTGFPLDSVTEDRETPTPSPVNFPANSRDSTESPEIPLISIDNNIVSIDLLDKSENSDESAVNTQEDFILESEPTFKYNDEKNIPMISSSESDTSTSEDDEPSESSTNYNILDDSYSPNESNIQEHMRLREKMSLNLIEDTEQSNAISERDAGSPEDSIKCALGRIDESKNIECDPVELNVVSGSDEIPTLLFSSSVSISDDKINDPQNSILPPIASISNIKLSSIRKLKTLNKQSSFDHDDGTFTTATPIEEKKNLSPIINPHVEKSLVSLIDFIPDVNSDTNESSLLSVKPQEIDEKITLDESWNKLQSEKNTRSSTASSLPYKKYLNHVESLQGEKSIEKKEKSSRKIKRTDTVIYKGPPKDKEKLAPSSSFKNTNEKTAQTSEILVANTPIIIVAPPSESECYLRVPMADTKAKNVHSPRPQENVTPAVYPTPTDSPPQELLMEPNLMHERFVHKYRQHCMVDLLKVIDAKMMVQTMNQDRKDSTKSKKKRRGNINSTPSPESIRKSRLCWKDSRSKSPEKHHHHHHHHHHPHPHPHPHHHHHHHHHHHSSSHSHQMLPFGTHSPNSNNQASNSLTSPSLKSLKEADTISCNSSLENSPRSVTNPCLNNNPQFVVCIKELAINCSDSNCNIRSCDDKIDDKDHELAVTKLALECSNDMTLNEDYCSIKMDSLKLSNETNNSGILLNPHEIDLSVHKSHSEGSLGKLRRNNVSLTYTTNNANVTDDPCVACLPITLRPQEEQHQQQHQQQHSTSPLHSKSTSSSVLAASVGAKSTNSPATKPPLHRRSSDSDLSITPKGTSLAGSERSTAGYLRPSTTIRTMNQDALEMLEYPFITIQQYPPGFILNLGGLVSARSVKLIEKLSNLEEPEGRDAWWTEIRMEVRSHARALGCNVILGYKEEISICDDVCVLNASGTAAVINLLNSNQEQDNLNRNTPATLLNSLESDKIQQKLVGNKLEKTDDSQLITISQQNNHSLTGKISRISECTNDNETNPVLSFQNSCNYCHLPYSETSVPFKVDVSKCRVCRRAKVPDVLFTTIELLDNIPITGRGVFLQATVCKNKRDLRGELNAKEISDCLPFLEYELHSLLLNKLKVKGMNAIFGLRIQISIGERFIVGMAVGTAVFLTALPTPLIPQIASGNSWHNEEQLSEIQRSLIETVKRNRELYYLRTTTSNEIENGRSIAVTTSDTDESDDELPNLDLGIGTKDACVLEVDDVEDMDRINLLMDETIPDGFHVVNTQSIPGLDDLEIVRNLQMFTQVSRAKIPAGQYASMPSKYFARMLQTVFFKLRRMVPCALCDMQFKIALTDQDEIQLSVVGMALGLGEPTKLMNKYKRYNNKGINSIAVSRDLVKGSDDNDLIFKLDEDQGENASMIGETINERTQEQSSSQSQPHQQRPSTLQQQQQQLTVAINSSPIIGQVQRPTRSRSPLKSKVHMQQQHRYKHMPLKERYGVDITPLSYLPGGRIERYLGNMNFFFIRESTSIRENGGLSGFTHSFITEVLAICRAHITALGGNAMVAFFMTQCGLLHSPHKNHGQCLINVGGDVVSVSYFGGERHNPNC